jgi:hypothetical protein
MKNTVVVVAACVAALSVVTQGFGAPAPPPSNRQTLHQIKLETGHEVTLLQHVYDQVRELHGRLDGLPSSVTRLRHTVSSDHTMLTQVQHETHVLFSDLGTRRPSIGQQIADLHNAWVFDIVNSQTRSNELDCIYERTVLGEPTTCTGK